MKLNIDGVNYCVNKGEVKYSGCLDYVSYDIFIDVISDNKKRLTTKILNQVKKSEVFQEFLKTSISSEIMSNASLSSDLACINVGNPFHSKYIIWLSGNRVHLEIVELTKTSMVEFHTKLLCLVESFFVSKVSRTVYSIMK